MNATSASWQFQVLNFPVRVHISFFLFTLLLGLSLGNVVLIALWVVIVFFSVLLHELGHAVVADYYGLSPHIELYSMGGLTIPSRYSVLSYPKEILLSFAGPLAGFIMGGILFAILRFGPPITNYYLNFVVGEMIWVNIGWGIINLIPMLPLDGGNIMRNLYHWIRSPYDERTPLIISIVFGVLAVIAALVLLRSIYMALLFGFLIYRNYLALRQGYWSDSIV